MEGTNGREPTVPFEVFDDYTQFRETGYDFVTMAQSRATRPPRPTASCGCWSRM